MDEIDASTWVTVRYWAGARAASGVEQERVEAVDVGQLRQRTVAAHPPLAEVMPRCSVLVDGRRSDDDVLLRTGAEVEVLPPFAGG